MIADSASVARTARSSSPLPVSVSAQPSSDGTPQLPPLGSTLTVPLAPGPQPDAPTATGFERFTDRVIRMAGSAPALGTAALFELGWLAAGAPAKFSNTWQLIMSDVSTVAVFWMNPILQNAENRHKAEMLAAFRHAAAVPRVLAERLGEGTPLLDGVVPSSHAVCTHHLNWFDRGVDAVGGFVGSPGFFAATLAGMGVWAGAGHFMNWSNSWQLIINSATSAFELPAALGLHNTKIRRDLRLGHDIINDAAHGEDMLRHMGYRDLPVPAAEPPAHARSILTYMADGLVKMEGSAVALGVQVGLVLCWPALGPVMHWNDNWQLVLGTATTIPSYIFLLVLMYAQNRHIADMKRDGRDLESHYLAGLEHINAPLAAQRRAEFAAANTRPGWLARVTRGCNSFAGSPLGLAVGIAALPLWATTKSFLDFTTWMLVINTGTMIVQTLSFILLMESHARADRWAHEQLRRSGLVRQDMLETITGEVAPPATALCEVVVDGGACGEVDPAAVEPA